MIDLANVLTHAYDFIRIIIFSMGFSNINHPTIGFSHLWKAPYVYIFVCIHNYPYTTGIPSRQNRETNGLVVSTEESEQKDTGWLVVYPT